MKKCGFLSPEALLQAEIFGNGSGGGSSNIVDASSYIHVVTGTRGIPIINAFYNTITKTGLFAVDFTADSSSCYIEISGLENGCFQDFLSSNNTASLSSNNAVINFSTVGSSETITVMGYFGIQEK